MEMMNLHLVRPRSASSFCGRATASNLNSPLLEVGAGATHVPMKLKQTTEHDRRLIRTALFHERQRRDTFYFSSMDG